jgi:histidinol phosphatase-like PHP family hydrolase
MDAYLADARAVPHPRPAVGLEVDVDFRLRPVVTAEHAAAVDLRLGAIHYLPHGGDKTTPADPDAVRHEFCAATEALCRSGIRVLAHPFRIFGWSKLQVPPDLYGWLPRLLRSTGVAAEINYHLNVPAQEFLRNCLEQGVRLALGSDAHALCAVGEFYPHLRTLQALGVPRSDLPRVLWQPPAA